MAIPIKIPCKKYLRDFLAFYFENKEVAFTENHEDFLFMRSLVTKTPNKLDSISSVFNSYVVLMIGTRNQDRKILYVSETSVHRFHIHFQRLFVDYFLQYMSECKLSPGYKTNTSIKTFIDKFGWTEDDIKMDALLKIHQRHCGTSTKKNNNKLTWTPPVVHVSVLF